MDKTNRQAALQAAVQLLAVALKTPSVQVRAAADPRSFVRDTFAEFLELLEGPSQNERKPVSRSIFDRIHAGEAPFSGPTLKTCAPGSGAVVKAAWITPNNPDSVEQLEAEVLAGKAKVVPLDPPRRSIAEVLPECSTRLANVLREVFGDRDFMDEITPEELAAVPAVGAKTVQEFLFYSK